MSPLSFASAPAVDRTSEVGTLPSAPAAASATIADILSVVWKRKWVIVAALLLGILYGLYKAHKQPHVYIASGTIEIKSGSANEYRLTTGGGDVGGTARLASQVQILKSDTLLLQVAKDLDLANDPRFSGHGPHRNLSTPAVRQSLLNALNGSVNATVIPKTDLIRIDCSTSNAEVSAAIINKLVDDFINHSSQVHIDFTRRVSQELTPQLDELKNQVENSQQRVIDLQKRLGVLGFDPSHNQVSNVLDDLSRATSQAEISRILAESRYNTLAGMDQNAIDSSIDSALGSAAGGPSLVSTLRGQLGVLQAQYAQLMTYLLPKNPQALAVQNQIAELQKEIDAEQKRLLTQARETYLATRRNETQTSAALDAQKQQAYTLRDDLVAYTLAQREYESNRTLYESLEQRLRTSAISAGLESNEIDVVDRAFPPISATFASRSSFIIVDSIGAIVLGLIVAFLLEAIDTKLRSVAEIESVTGLPSLALIPRNRRGQTAPPTASAVEQNLAVVANPKSQFSESFRALRTSVLLSTTGHPPKVILVISATPSEGKTTVSTNLACVLAQSGASTLLIDGDLRRPTIHHRFGVNGRIGLTSVLTGAVSIDDAVQTVKGVPNLTILPSGPVPPFPTEMLGSGTMAGPSGTVPRPVHSHRDRFATRAFGDRWRRDVALRRCRLAGHPPRQERQTRGSPRARSHGARRCPPHRRRTQRRRSEVARILRVLRVLRLQRLQLRRC